MRWPMMRRDCLTARESGLRGVTGPRVREPCSQQERVLHRAFARLPLAWCTFPVEFAPRSAPVPDQHADPRPRGRARPGRAESRHDEVTMSTGHEAVKNDTDRHRKAAATHLPTCLQRRPCRRIMKHGLP